jgi:hypothetical protein
MPAKKIVADSFRIMARRTTSSRAIVELCQEDTEERIRTLLPELKKDYGRAWYVWAETMIWNNEGMLKDCVPLKG